MLKDTLNQSQKMDLTNSVNNITLCTYNCRSVKSSVIELQELCAKSDLVCLQEHWLLPNEVSLLSHISADFLAVGSSAVDTSEDILTGRPYGGTAILCRKVGLFLLFLHVTLVYPL